MKIFVTNLPSFYKIRLFNAINEKERILVVYTGVENYTDRNRDFFSGEMKYTYRYINSKGVSKFFELWQLLHTYKKECREVVIGGWDSLMNWAAAFSCRKVQKAVQVESSIFESTVTGLKGLLKKVFLTRIETAYVSGKAHKALLEQLGFKKTIKITGGVGLMNRVPQPAFVSRSEVRRFIYVGRLVEVKNLELLITVFNELPEFHLTIVGFGVLEEQLKALAGQNITFSGAVKNTDLSSYYQASDVFILPSKSESWGLVVEEALNNGLPVIVSDRVGCKDDLVTEETGLIFKSGDKADLKRAVLEIANPDLYNKLRRGVSKLDFENREQAQINVYL